MEAVAKRVALVITAGLLLMLVPLLFMPAYYKAYALMHPMRDVPNAGREAYRRLGGVDGPASEALKEAESALLDDAYDDGSRRQTEEQTGGDAPAEAEEAAGAQVVTEPEEGVGTAEVEPEPAFTVEPSSSSDSYVADSYRSVGMTEDVRGDLEDESVFRNVCTKRAYKRELIMITTDMARPEYAASFARHLVDDWGFDHYIVIGINEQVCSQLHSLGITCVTSTFLEKKRPWNKRQTLKQGYSIGWLWIMRTYMMRRFIECGLNVLSVDSDVAILRDFYADFKGKWNKANLAIQAGSDAFPASCAGVIYHQNAKPHGGTWFFFNEVVQRQIEAMDGPVQIALRGGVEIDGVFSFDQGIVNDVLESSVGAEATTCSEHVRNGGSYKTGALAASHGEAFMKRANSAPDKCDASFRQQYREMQAWPDWYEAHTNPDWKWNKDPSQLNALRLPHGQDASELEYVLGVPSDVISGYGDDTALQWGNAPSHAPAAIAHAVGQPGGIHSKKILLKFMGFYKFDMEKANPGTWKTHQAIEGGNVKFCILDGMSAPDEGGAFSPSTLDDYKAHTQRFFDLCASLGRAPVVPFIPCNLVHPFNGNNVRSYEVIVKSNTGKPGNPKPQCVFNPYVHAWFQCGEHMVLHMHDVERIRSVHPELLSEMPTVELTRDSGAVSRESLLKASSDASAAQSALGVRFTIGAGGVPQLSPHGLPPDGKRNVARLRAVCNACTNPWGGGELGELCAAERARDAALSRP